MGFSQSQTFVTAHILTTSIQGNLVSGTIPKELGSITTLTYLNLEDNLLQGHSPLELGNLTNLQRLCLVGNNLSGTLPATFSRLTNIQYFLLDGNPLTGRIPDLAAVVLVLRGHWQQQRAGGVRVTTQADVFERRHPEGIDLPSLWNLPHQLVLAHVDLF